MSKFSRWGGDLYSGERSIDFVGRKWIWYAMSAVIVLVSLVGLQVKPLDLGIEFVGGAEFKVTLPASQVTQDNADRLREAVAGTGIENAAAPVASTSGNEAILVQTQPLTADESDRVVEVIAEAVGADPVDDVNRSEVGPSWGEQVAKRSLIGLGIFLVLVALFIAVYFREWKMSVAALVALAHDVLITTGVYAWSGFEVTPATVTGLLTILGFSLYDTVVVFDKVRENTANLRRTHLTYAQASNLAVNQTLVRSINTSVVALLPVAAILYVGVAELGSGSLKDLALALFVGMAAGTYSSIFVATPLLAHLKGAEKEVRDSDRRAKARKRHDADRYASVPTFTEDLPLYDEPEEPDPATAGQGAAAPARAVRREPAAGKGRVAPPPRSDLRPSAAANRVQPTRVPRSKRGKK